MSRSDPRLGNTPVTLSITAGLDGFGDHARVQLVPYRAWFLFHPREIEAVLTARADDFVRFERVMRVLAQWNGDSLLIREGEAWKARRRAILPSFARRCRLRRDVGPRAHAGDLAVRSRTPQAPGGDLVIAPTFVIHRDVARGQILHAAEGRRAATLEPTRRAVSGP